MGWHGVVQSGAMVLNVSGRGCQLLSNAFVRVPAKLVASGQSVLQGGACTSDMCVVFKDDMKKMCRGTCRFRNDFALFNFVSSAFKQIQNL